MKAFTAGAFALLALFVAPAANATTIDVNTTDDTLGGTPATCSLREAITAANTDSSYDGCTQGSGADEIRLPAGTYKITIAGAGEDNNTTGDFDIRGAGALTIGPATENAAVKIDGNGLDRVFDQATTGAFSLRNLWITGGDLAGQIADGGGIINTTGQLSVDGSTVSDNHSEHEAGGIAVYSSMTMINSTVSGNRADGNGGGLYLPGAATATVRSSTIALNVADSDGNGNGRGGGFADAAASSINFTNVINAGNEGKPATPPGQATDCSAGPTFFPRYTLQTQPLGPLDCLVGFNPGTNLVVEDAKLGPLADNGGPTPTHALLDGSPAIGAGGTSAPDQCPSTDQNGRARPADSCDIGAAQYFKPAEQPLPGVKNPTDAIAAFDGKRLHIRLKCPARFRPKCRSVAVPMTKKKRGKPMGKAKKVVTKSNKWKRVTFLIKPAFRARVEKMTYVDAKRLVVRQKIRSKRVFRKRAKKPSTIFHVYKVRVKL
jgi:CSLREA domain-containing protein